MERQSEGAVPGSKSGEIMELSFQCPGCGAVGTAAPIEARSEIACRSCGRSRAVRTESFEADGLRACPLCATEDLYLQKDFPQGLGLAIVIAGFALSTVLWYYDRPLPGLSFLSPPLPALLVLLVSALADMALFYLVPDVTICYRCLSQIRGEGANPRGRFRAFDLAVGERYRQERLRVEHLRERSSPADQSDPAP
jgi:hypothetical protein